MIVRHHRGKPRCGEDIEGFQQAAAAEVEHVVVGEHADIRPDGGQRLGVCRIHPVVDGFARDVVVTGGDAGFQIDDPGVAAGVRENCRASPQGHDQSTGCGMLPFALIARST